MQILIHLQGQKVTRAGVEAVEVEVVLTLPEGKTEMQAITNTALEKSWETTK